MYHFYRYFKVQADHIRNNLNGILERQLDRLHLNPTKERSPLQRY